MADLLSAAEVQEKLVRLDGWSLEGDVIKTVKKFAGFPEAIAFVSQLVDPAEAAGHHPDISISYNKVTISLTTHDAGGLTQKDFDLATIISRLS
ncbi:MAG: 4a-hydroxytetrahydrobiopterin dehydratase [Leptolyngbyaceae cyanobacterium]